MMIKPNRARAGRRRSPAVANPSRCRSIACGGGGARGKSIRIGDVAIDAFLEAVTQMSPEGRRDLTGGVPRSDREGNAGALHQLRWRLEAIAARS